MYAPQYVQPEGYSQSTSSELPPYTLPPGYEHQYNQASSQYFPSTTQNPNGYPTEKQSVPSDSPAWKGSNIPQQLHAEGMEVHYDETSLNAKMEKIAIANATAQIVPLPTPPYSIPPTPLDAYDVKPTQPVPLGAPPTPMSMPTTSPATPITFDAPPPSAQPNHKVKDQQRSGGAKRFFGDTLVGRFARASVQTATSTLKMPHALSPWGDNNPVTLPNVRYRDAVLFTTFSVIGTPLIEGIDSGVSDIFGADSFVSEIVGSGAGAITGSTILKYGIFQIVEQAIDKGILERMLPEEEKITTTTSVTTIQGTVRHKLMGVDADIRFWGVYPARDSKACDKGWFCPYLFASSRTPLVPRSNDFGIAQFYGPFLGADYGLAHKLLATSANVLGFCDATPTTDIGANRLVVLFTAIAPFRGGMWSTSRRPGCAMLMFHVMNGCPALVLPVNPTCPVMAWSPWTLSQMRGSSFGGGSASMYSSGVGAYGVGQGMVGSGYDPALQHEQICEWLEAMVSLPHVDPKLQNRFHDVLGRSVSLVINGALGLNQVDRNVVKAVDPERAGIVMFRY